MLHSCAALPTHHWVVEVVADNYMNMRERTGTDVLEVTVPKEYRCPNGGKFKARALHYASIHSQARREDWVVHMDEETRFDAATVAHVLEHCLKENSAWRAAGEGPGRSSSGGDGAGYGHIGQGVICYNPGLCCLFLFRRKET